ncbi:hypothetical protein H9P43_001152 [Blastocladiella emersonii ATCC 22665]|nr:hypothetical protein H9P43_001152 [Blastocladiella emersonii ATCC 22665]
MKLPKHTLLAIFLALAVVVTSALAQAVTVDPGPAPTATIPPPAASQTPGTKAANCTALKSCGACVASSDCGWCDYKGGQCINAFNYWAPGAGSDTCYGQIDSYYWMQCSIGARTTSILAIAGGIVLAFIVMGFCACLIRLRRRGGIGDTSFTRMVDDFERRYQGKGTSNDKTKKKRTGTSDSSSAAAPAFALQSQASAKSKSKTGFRMFS